MTETQRAGQVQQAPARQVEDHERRQQIAEGLRDILAVLNSNRPLSEILDYIVSQASRLLVADASAIYRLTAEQKVLTIQSAYRLDTDYIANGDIPLGQVATGQAALTRQPAILPDVLAVNSNVTMDGKRQTLLESLSHHYRAVLAVPLIIKDELYGTITLYYREPRTFSAEEIGLAVAFGDQAALALENARLRAQAAELAAAAERNRLARDLHDSVTQMLFTASVIAEVLPMIWEQHQDQARQSLEELRYLTRGALAEMRTMLLELRPTALAEARLDDLLRQLAEAVTGRALVPVVVTVEGQPRLPADVRIAFYRIAQEALNNISKHAKAGQATITLHCSPPRSQGSDGESANQRWNERVELGIADDGCGFDLGKVSSECLGLGMMRERAEAMGARLAIDSRPDHGTQIIVTWQPH